MSFTKFRSVNLAVFLLLVLCCSGFSSCRAQNHQNQSLCQPSSCGNIPEISYPFRLKGAPNHCGKRGFELDCRGNRTIISLNSRTFHVQDISYDNYTIRMVDPGLEQQGNLCSYPNSSLADIYIPSDTYSTIRPGNFVNDFIDLNTMVVFVNCLAPVNSPSYIDISTNSTSCGNRNATFASNSSEVYSYVTVGKQVDVSDLPDSCSVDKVAWASFQGPIAAENASWPGIQRGLAFGFELSWIFELCVACDSRRSSCIIINNAVTCREYCYEHMSYEDRSFSCKLEFHAPEIIVYGGGAIAILLVVRFLIGMCCLGGVVRYQWKRRHLWASSEKDQVSSSVVEHRHRDGTSSHEQSDQCA